MPPPSHALRAFIICSLGRSDASMNLWHQPDAFIMLEEAMNSVHCLALLFPATGSCITHTVMLTAPSDDQQLARFATQCRLWSSSWCHIGWGLHCEPFSHLTGHKTGNFRSGSNAISLISDCTSTIRSWNGFSVVARGCWRRRSLLVAWVAGYPRPLHVVPLSNEQ
jgi:hypothetical protein